MSAEPFRTSASRRTSPCESMSASGMSVASSSRVAYPNIIPWSPAPCSPSAPASTPMAMSGLWAWIEVRTPHDWASNRRTGSVYPMSVTVWRTTSWTST